MDDENDNLTIDTSSPLTMPIIEHNDKILSSMTTNISITSSQINENIIPIKENEKIEENLNENNSHTSNLDYNKNQSPISQSHSSQTIISTILNEIITQIETNNNNNNNNNYNNNQLNSLPIIEDDQMEIEEEDDDDDDENDDDEEEQENSEKTSSNKSTKVERERLTTKISSTKHDLKPTTRTLRSHARGKINISTLISTSSNTANNVRRVSNRRRELEKKHLLTTNEKEKKRKSISERSKKDKDNTTINDDVHTSSNSDDQTLENTNAEKVSTTTTNPNDDVSSCSSTGAGDGSSTSSSTTNIKQLNTTTDIDSLPPNKRRLRERNAGISNTSIPPLTTDPSINSNSTATTDNSSVETTTTITRELPVNSIKQFLEIRQQIDKRHETMLNEFVLPKVPKDFSETTMVKKNYLIAPSFSSYSITTPLSIGIKRLLPPHDLDSHLAEVFTKQEDERYKMKLRHQVERDKLILSHEQEILRLYGNATRLSVNQDIPFSYCSLLKDNEVYSNPSIPLPEKLLNNDYTNTELGKRGKHRWNGRLFIKWVEDSNLKYKRLSCEINERQRLEADTLYSMQRMVWTKHLPKESSNLSLSGRMGYFLTERYLPKVEINPNFWTDWETSPF